MKSISSRLRTLIVPLRIAMALKGWRMRNLLHLYLFLGRIAVRRRKAVTLHLSFSGRPFAVHIENASDLAAVREVFLDKEYRHPRMNDAQVVFDVGANIGIASIYFACLYPEAAIHAFEPDPILYEKLVHNTMPFSNIATHRIALTDADGYADFYIRTDAPLSGSLVRRAGAWDAISVPTRRLSTMARELGIGMVDIIKFDIEGGEQRLFADERDRAVARSVIGEVHLDIMRVRKEEFIGLFSGFVASFSHRTGKERYIFAAVMAQ